MSDQVFISYRREGTRSQARDLCRELRDALGYEAVFLDTSSIPLGERLPEIIKNAVQKAKVVLVLIGPRWLLAADEYGKRLIDEPNDWVRRELVLALTHAANVIPVMVDCDSLPPRHALPEDIGALTELNASLIRTDCWENDIVPLVERVLKLCGVSPGRARPVSAKRGTAGVDASEALALFRDSARSAYKDFVFAGFKKKLRVRIRLDDLYVPLHAQVDLRGLGKAEFANVAEAEAALAGKSHEISLAEAFREMAARNRDGVVILGEPGSGKSTQLKRLLLACIGDGSGSLGLDPDMVPVLVPLRDTDDANMRPAGFVMSALRALDLARTMSEPALARFADALVARGRLLLLLDGLDEVRDPAMRAAVARSIEQGFGLSCVPVVTCRFAGYSDAVRLNDRFLELHVRPLTPAQSDDFIRNWYHAVETQLGANEKIGAQQAKERADGLIEALQAPEFRAARLATMLRNPLLLPICASCTTTAAPCRNGAPGSTRNASTFCWSTGEG